MYTITKPTPIYPSLLSKLTTYSSNDDCLSLIDCKTFVEASEILSALALTSCEYFRILLRLSDSSFDSSTNPTSASSSGIETLFSTSLNALCTRSLSLAFTSLSEKSILSIQSILEQLASISTLESLTLDLSNCGINSELLEEFIEEASSALQECKQLKDLTIILDNNPKIKAITRVAFFCFEFLSSFTLKARNTSLSENCFEPFLFRLDSLKHLCFDLRDNPKVSAMTFSSFRDPAHIYPELEVSLELDNSITSYSCIPHFIQSRCSLRLRGSSIIRNEESILEINLLEDAPIHTILDLQSALNPLLQQASTCYLQQNYYNNTNKKPISNDSTQQVLSLINQYYAHITSQYDIVVNQCIPSNIVQDLQRQANAKQSTLIEAIPDVLQKFIPVRILNENNNSLIQEDQKGVYNSIEEHEQYHNSNTNDTDENQLEDDDELNDAYARDQQDSQEEDYDDDDDDDYEDDEYYNEQKDLRISMNSRVVIDTTSYDQVILDLSAFSIDSIFDDALIFSWIAQLPRPPSQVKLSQPASALSEAARVQLLLAIDNLATPVKINEDSFDLTNMNIDLSSMFLSHFEVSDLLKLLMNNIVIESLSLNMTNIEKPEQFLAQLKIALSSMMNLKHFTLIGPFNQHQFECVKKKIQHCAEFKAISINQPNINTQSLQATLFAI